MHLLNTDLKLYVGICTTKYNLIICNPPYFNDSLKSPNDQKTLARHTDSLPFLVLLESVSSLLHEEGKFSVVLPYDAKMQFISMARTFNLHYQVGLSIKPSSRKDFNRVLMTFSKQDRKAEESELIMRDEDGSYTNAYKKLTKDFYLSF